MPEASLSNVALAENFPFFFFLIVVCALRVIEKKHLEAGHLVLRDTRSQVSP